jgi:uncharacterized MAPEG superfamily protein
MKNCNWSVYIMIFLFALMAQSCRTKSGCPANESLRAKTNRKGEFRAGNAKSNLFPKSMRKQMQH